MDCSLPGSSAHGIFQAKDTGVGCHFLLQGIFLTQESNLQISRVSCIGRWILYHCVTREANGLGTPVENHMAVYIRQGFFLDSILFHQSVFMPAPHCSDDCSFVVSSEIRKCEKGFGFYRKMNPSILWQVIIITGIYKALTDVCACVWIHTDITNRTI